MSGRTDTRSPREEKEVYNNGLYYKFYFEIAIIIYKEKEYVFVLVGAGWQWI